MINKNKFDVRKLIGKPCKIRDWMREKQFSPRLIFILLGIFLPASFCYTEDSMIRLLQPCRPEKSTAYTSRYRGKKAQENL